VHGQPDREHVRESQVSRGCGPPGLAGSAMENRTTRPAAAACRRRTGGRSSRPVVISEVRRSKVAVLAWARPAAWKGMLIAVLTHDQRAKNEATFSYQFGYQLANERAYTLLGISHQCTQFGNERHTPLAFPGGHTVARVELKKLCPFSCPSFLLSSSILPKIDCKLSRLRPMICL
jgi:hypothetical protein